MPAYRKSAPPRWSSTSLNKLLALKRVFFEWYKCILASGLPEPAENFKTLEAWLQSTLESLDRPLIFAIDGLDECDGQSRGQLLASLKAISETTPSLKLQVVSTRPEEVILRQLEGTSKIVMEFNAEQDRHIAEKTVETRLPDLTDEVKALVIDALSGSAQGSAIWTRMTVELIAICIGYLLLDEIGNTTVFKERSYFEELPQDSTCSPTTLCPRKPAATARGMIGN